MEKDAAAMRQRWGSDKVFETLKPHYKILLRDPFVRNERYPGLSSMMSKAEMDEYLKREYLRVLLLTDPYLPDLIESEGLIEIMNTHIRLSVNDDTCREYFSYFSKLLVSAVAKGYSANWKKLLATMKQRTNAYKEAKDSNGVEFTAFVAALAHISLTERCDEEKCRLCNLLLCYWRTLAYCLSITLDMCVGCAFKNVYQIVPQFTSTQQRFSHLMLRCLARNPQTLSSDRCDKQKRRVDALRKLLDASGSPLLNHELDDLFRIIFPNVKFDEEWVMAKIRQIQREVEGNYARQKAKNQQLFEKMRTVNRTARVEELEAALRKQLKESLPADALVNTILEAEPHAAEALFKQLDWGLGDIPAWAERKESIKAKIKMKQQAEEQRRETLTKVSAALQQLVEKASEGALPFNYFGPGSTHYDYSKHLTVGNDNLPPTDDLPPTDNDDTKQIEK